MADPFPAPNMSTLAVLACKLYMLQQLFGHIAKLEAQLDQPAVENKECYQLLPANKAELVAAVKHWPHVQ